MRVQHEIQKRQRVVKPLGIVAKKDTYSQDEINRNLYLQSRPFVVEATTIFHVLSYLTGPVLVLPYNPNRVFLRVDRMGAIENYEAYQPGNIFLKFGSAPSYYKDYADLFYYEEPGTMVLGGTRYITTDSSVGDVTAIVANPNFIQIDTNCPVSTLWACQDYNFGDEMISITEGVKVYL